MVYLSKRAELRRGRPSQWLKGLFLVHVSGTLGTDKGLCSTDCLETQAGEGHHLVRLPSQLVASGLTNKGERLC